MESVKNAPPNGDRCTVDWGFHARNEAEAKEICTDMGIHHLRSWDMDSGGYPQCEYESIHICKNGWKQIRGRCYKIGADEMLAYSDAVAKCCSEGAEIFSYYDEEIARILAEYFADLPGIWVDVPGSLDVEIFYNQHGKGVNHMVAYGSASWYGLGYLSLVKLDDKALGTVMCEYIPQDSALSFRVKLEKLSPYYYPARADGATTFWRKASYYDDRTNETSPYAFREQCQKSLKPLLNSKMGNSLDPSLEQMSQMPMELKKSVVITTAPLRSCRSDDDRLISQAAVPFREVGDCDLHHVTSKKYNIDCSDCRDKDPRTQHIIFHPDGEEYKIETALKQFGILWCTVEYLPPKNYKPCDPDWTQYDRKDGSRWCHNRFGPENKRNFFGARDFCNRFKAQLGGWEEMREFEKLKKMGDGHFFIVKNEKCDEMKNTGACSRSKMFFHMSRAGDRSSEGQMLIGKLLAPGQPDGGTNERFVTIRQDGLHDVNGEEEGPFFCSKEAEEDI